MRLDIDKYAQYWSGHRAKLQAYSKDEVEEVFCVSLSWLLAYEPEMYSAKAHFIPGKGFPADTVPGGFMMGKQSLTMQIPVYRYGKNVIWGATARILESFLNRAKEIVAEETV